MEDDRERYQSHTDYPVLDLSMMESLEDGIILEDIEKEAYWDCTFTQTYLKPRFDDLMGAYKSGRIPSDWRLVSGIFPDVGDEDELHLTVLLKPVKHEVGFKTAYCISRYRQVPPLKLPSEKATECTEFSYAPLESNS